jgi:hypothetical protein
MLEIYHQKEVNMWNPFSDATEGAVKGFGEAIATAVGAFKADPTKVAELEAAIEQSALHFKEEVAEAGAKQIEAVNATMQAEAASTSWLQQDWRPIIGLTYATMLVNNYILMPWLSNFFAMQIIDIPTVVIQSMMALLGVTTTVTGVEKVFKTVTGKK